MSLGVRVGKMTRKSGEFAVVVVAVVDVNLIVSSDVTDYPLYVCMRMCACVRAAACSLMCAMVLTRLYCGCSIIFDRHLKLMVGLHVKHETLGQIMTVELARALLLPQGLSAETCLCAWNFSFFLFVGINILQCSPTCTVTV